MANDKDQARDKNMNENQEPIVETNNNNSHHEEGEEDEDDDFLKLTLVTRSQPDRPSPTPTMTIQSDAYLSSMYGLLQDHSSNLPMSSLTTLYPFFQPQNPNPNPGLSPESVAPPNPNPSPNKRSRYGPIQSARPLAVRKRRNGANRGLRSGKSQTVEPPFLWATNRRATVHSLEKLGSLGIETVMGEVQCRRCEKRFEVGYEVRAEFSKLRRFIEEKKDELKDRSAPEWDTPVCLDCKHCLQRESVKAVVADKKRNINWLFLLLGGFLCNCTLEQLKYFCKHTGNHRTGAKNRVLYLTYLGLCKQLDPSGPFEPLAR